MPRDISGESLIIKLKKLGYKTTRQLGSHVRLTTHINGEHHITIPNHSSIKLGTLSAILRSISDHHKIEKQQLILDFFT